MLRLPFAIAIILMPLSFADAQRTNERPADGYKPHVTVIYRTGDRVSAHVRQAFQTRPELVDLRNMVHLRAVNADTDPLYETYLQKYCPVVPAIIVTMPPEKSGPYAGQARAVYHRYGPDLYRDPVSIAIEIYNLLKRICPRCFPFAPKPDTPVPVTPVNVPTTPSAIPKLVDLVHDRKTIFGFGEDTPLLAVIAIALTSLWYHQRRD